MSVKVYDFILTSFLLKTSENLHMESSYKVLCLCKIWFSSRKGERSHIKIYELRKTEV